MGFLQEVRRISSNILTATDGRDVLHNSPDGWEVEQPWLWWQGPANGIQGPFGNPIPGAFEGSQLAAIPAVARATSVIVDSLSALPWKVYREREQLPTPDWIADPQALRLDGRVVDPEALPDVRLSHMDFWSNWLTDALWWGDGLIWSPNRDSAGGPRPPMALIHPFQWDMRDGGYWVRDKRLDATELIHLRGPGPIRNGRGIGAFQRFAAELGYTLTVKDYAHSIYFAGVPSGYLRVLREGLTQEKADELSWKWDSKHGQGSRRTAVLNSTTEYTPLTWSPVDAALTAVMSANLAEIANAFNIPSYLLGGAIQDSTTYANIESRRRDLVTFTYLPWSSRIEAVLDSQFPRGTSVKIALDGLQRADSISRGQFLSTMVSSGIYSKDEARALEDLEPLGEPETPEPEPEVVA